MLIFWETYLIVRSLAIESSFLSNIIDSVITWKQRIFLLMSEYVLITRVVYFLYMILLGLFGVLLGFLLGVRRRYKCEDEIYVFLLLFLFQILYNNRFDDVLLEILRRRSLELGNIEEFSKFSLKSIEQIEQRPSKITLKKPDQSSQILLPFPIMEDPLIVIETEVFWKKSRN